MKKFLILILNLVLIIHLNGQDIHFSQITAVPQLINPAQTGHFNEQLRAGLVYRNQGASFTVPYKTYSATADLVLAPAFLGSSNTAGAGLVIFHDDAGDGTLQQTTAYFSGAFHKGLNHFGTLVGSVGFSIGLGNRSVDYSKLVFGNQWTGLHFDTTVFSGEKNTVNSFFYADLNAGFMLSYKISKNLNFSSGISLNHINKPPETFYNGTSHLGWKWIFHGHAGIRVNEKIEFQPGFAYYLMNGIDEFNAGTNLVLGEQDLKLITGLWYRAGRDVIPMAGVAYKNFSLVMSYDVTVSALHEANHYSGGFEVSIFGAFYVKKERCDNVIF